MKKLFLALFLVMIIVAVSLADGIQIQSRGAKKGVNDDITSMTGLDDNGIPGAKVAAATDIAEGVSELATDAETVTGTATDRVTTPANITAKMTAPGAIGGTTPAAGAFTTLSTTGDVTGDEWLIGYKNFAAMHGPGYWFDGIDDVIVVDNDSAIDITTNDFSIILGVKLLESAGARGFVHKYQSGTDSFAFYLDSAHRLNFYVEVGNVAYGNYQGVVIDIADTDAVVGFVSDRDGVKGQFYLNGGTTTTNENTAMNAASITNTGDLQFARQISSGVYTNLVYSRYSQFNLALTATEAKKLYSGIAIPFRYGPNATDKPGDVRNSGNFVIGAEYIITTRTDGDFQSAGAADDVVGTRFTATATAAGVLDAGDTATRLGCVLNLPPSGVGKNQWTDNSGNESKTTVSGALTINIPPNHREKYVDLAVTGDTSFTLPKGYIINSIVLTSDGAIGGGIDIGTTDGGGEIVTAQAIAGSGTVLCTLVAGANYNTTGADDIIYVTDADGTGWDAATVGIRVQMERVALN